MNIDDELRGWGERARQDAPAIEAGAPRRGPGRAPLAAAAAVVVIAAAVTVPLLVHRSQSAHRSSPAGSVAGVSTVLPSAQPGLRLTGLHGLFLQIPKAWATNAMECGTAMRDTTITWTGGFNDCLVQRPEGIGSVQFTESDELTQEVPLVGTSKPDWSATRTATVSGQPAQSRSGAADDLALTQLAVPSRSVNVLIATPSRALTDRIADSAVISAVDPSGCASRTTTSPELRTDQPPVRPGAGSRLIPDGAVDIRVCNYGAGFVRTSSLVTTVRTTALVAALGRIPSGESRVDPKNYLPSLCPDPDHVNNPFSFQSQDKEWSVLTARYPSGRDVTVTVRLDLCGLLGAANGSYSVQRTDALIDALKDYTAFSGWSGRVLPVR